MRVLSSTHRSRGAVEAPVGLAARWRTPDAAERDALAATARVPAGWR